MAAGDTAAVPFSQNPAAEKAIRAGEEAYSHGDFDQALAAYKRALELDPRSYEAALYAGDMMFKKGDWKQAGEWFAHAIKINENRETAYRYWGDALMGAGQMSEARDKFIEAIIAEPYDRRAATGLLQWADKYQVRIGHPLIQSPNKIRANGDKDMTLTLDPKTFSSADGSNNWMLYDLTRVAWTKGDFASAYPQEKTYRHSLREEAAALKMVADAAAKDLASGKVKTLSPPLATLVKLNNDGLIESYVLFARPDEGIARDYAAYRAVNRDKMRQYWTRYVIASDWAGHIQ